MAWQRLEPSLTIRGSRLSDVRRRITRERIQPRAVHDNLVTLRCAPARVDWQPMTRKTGKDRSRETGACGRDRVRIWPLRRADRIHGVTHDGRRVWAATGVKLVAFDPKAASSRTRDAHFTMNFLCKSMVFDRPTNKASKQSLPLNT
jgi:hypothetical protein